MNELAKLNIARQALAEAKTLEDIKQIKDIAVAVRAYAQAKGLGIEMKNEASEIEIRAIREMGRLIQEKQEKGEIARQGQSYGNGSCTTPEHEQPGTLTEIGVTRKESSTSKNLASIPDLKFEEILNGFLDEGKPLTKTAMLREIAKDSVDISVVIPEGVYRVIYADPPWRYSDKKEYAPQGAAENHYPSMSIQELCEMNLPVTEDNAVLFLWTTSPLLEDSFKVIQAWGFKYKTSFVWDKIRHNMGHYNSVRHEFLLIATKGSCLPDHIELFDSVQSIEKTDNHSEKPERFYEIIETLYTQGNKIELFARNKRKGWNSYGNQLQHVLSESA
jgi:N6-adenosine-specific RNA methylase IME4